MATPHLLMKLHKQNMAKTPFKLAASEPCGVCAAECLVVTVYVSPKVRKRGREDAPIILAGDFNVNVKDKYNT
jgi:aldehyde:ferredoxin oxidoreductase